MRKKTKIKVEETMGGVVAPPWQIAGFVSTKPLCNSHSQNPLRQKYDPRS
jgi:hypothetical protein